MDPSSTTTRLRSVEAFRNLWVAIAEMLTDVVSARSFEMAARNDTCMSSDANLMPCLHVSIEIRA